MGCSQSSTTAVVSNVLTEAPPPEIQQLQNVPLPTTVPSHSSALQADRIVEDCVVLWFQPDPSRDMHNEKTKLHHVVSIVRVFINSEDFIVYIKKIYAEKLFLIIPSFDGFLQEFEELLQIEKIYILKNSIDDTMMDSSPALRKSFSNFDHLCQQLKNDIELCEHDLINLTTTPVHKTDEIMSIEGKQQEASFLCVQLMREILFRIKFDNNAKNDFVKFCRLHYADNDQQLRLIDEFDQHYRPQQALHWLLKHGFLWRMIQRMQRTQEIDVLYKLGFFLKHCHAQLNLFQENNATVVNDTTVVVYRGKTLSEKKFDNLLKSNQSGLLSFDSFLVTYFNQDYAMDFIRRRQLSLPQVIGILFEIHVESKTKSLRSPFASLDQIYPDDQVDNNGILFGMHTVFRIESLEMSPNEAKIWQVKLSLIADDDAQLLRVTSSLRSNDVHSNPLSYMGKLLMDKGDYDQAEQFFLEILNDVSIQRQPQRLARVQKGLATNYLHKKEYDQALGFYQQALQNSLTFLTPDSTELVSLYDAIGKCFYEQGNYQQAIENYEKAADLLGHQQQSSTVVNDYFATDLNARMIHARKLLQNKE